MDIEFAKFLGGEYEGCSKLSPNVTVMLDSQDANFGEDVAYEPKLKFHEDLNELFKVVDKIEELGYVVVIMHQTCDITHKEVFTRRIDFESEEARKYYFSCDSVSVDKYCAIYCECFQFVTFHNATKP